MFPLLPPGDPTEHSLETVLQLISNIIAVITTLASVVAIIYILIGAIKYATAFGNPDETTAAKKTILWAIIGLIISVSCYLIIRFIWSRLTGS